MSDIYLDIFNAFARVIHIFASPYQPEELKLAFHDAFVTIMKKLRNWEIWSFYGTFSKQQTSGEFLPFAHHDFTLRVAFSICDHSINSYNGESKIWAENLFASSWPWPWCWLEKFNAKNFFYTRKKKRSNRARRKKSKHPSISNDMYGIRSVHSLPFSVLLLHDLFIIILFFCCGVVGVLFCTLSLADINTSDATWKQKSQPKNLLSFHGAFNASRFFWFWAFYLFAQRRTPVCTARTRKVKAL